MTRLHLGRRVRRPAALAAMIALSGCTYSGNPADDGQGGTRSLPGAGVSAELSWSAASGPVSGYRVYLSLNEGPFEVTADVTSSSVSVAGEPLDTLRIQVAAFGADGTLGPLSAPSDLILLTPDGSALVISTAAPTLQATHQGTTATPLSARSEPATAGVGTPATSGATTADGETPRAIPGDAVASLLWEAGDFLRITHLSGGAVEDDAVFVRPDPEWSLVGSADFDGDGRRDPLWERDDGELAYTPLALALETPDAPLTALAGLFAGESVVGSGDLDADGLADLLVSNGQAVDGWFAGAGPDMLVEPIATLEIGGEIAAVGDLDGDGHADLVWRGPDGAISAWLMAGALPREIVDLTLGAGAEILACADVDGDGADDLVVLDPESGALSIHPLTATPWDVAPTSAGLDLAGSGDYDGDGQADLLWQSDAGLELWSGLDAGRVVPQPIASSLDADWSLVVGEL